MGPTYTAVSGLILPNNIVSFVVEAVYVIPSAVAGTVGYATTS